MLREKYSFATWVYAIYRALSSAGFNADHVMRDADFDYASLTSKAQQVPKKSLIKIWQEAERASGNDAFSLSVLAHVSDPYVTALITSAQSSTSIQKALDLLLRYYRVVISDALISATINDTLDISIAHCHHNKTVPYQEVDIAFGMIAKHGSVLPFQEVRPLSVQLTRTQPTNNQAYRDYFGCPISFGAQVNLISFPKYVLEQEIPSASPMLSTHVQSYLSEQLMGDDALSFAHDVEKVLIKMLPNGTPKLRDVAYKLNLSERTLQRKLQQHALNFSSVLRQTRLALARQYLKQSGCSIEHVADQLGFTETGNFIRFFKQQTGETPLSFAK